MEGELERNPLLERANDEESPAPNAETNGSSPENADDGPANSDWMGAALETSRSSMEQGLGTELENVFPDDGGENPTIGRERSAGLFGVVWSNVGRGLRTTILRLSSRSRQRLPITSPSKWPGFQPGRANDRAIPDRYGRRGRLSDGRS